MIIVRQITILMRIMEVGLFIFNIQNNLQIQPPKSTFTLAAPTAHRRMGMHAQGHFRCCQVHTGFMVHSKSSMRAVRREGSACYLALALGRAVLLILMQDATKVTK